MARRKSVSRRCLSQFVSTNGTKGDSVPHGWVLSLVNSRRPVRCASRGLAGWENSTTQPRGWGILKVESLFLFARLHRNAALFIFKGYCRATEQQMEQGQVQPMVSLFLPAFFFFSWTAVWTLGILRLRLKLSGFVVSNFNHWTVPAGPEHHLTIDKICPHLSLSSSLEGPATQQEVLSEWWDTAC